MPNLAHTELVEDIREFVMNVRDNDGDSMPPVGNTAIRIHPTPKDEITNPQGFGAASFRFGDKLYTMVTVPNVPKDPKALPGVTTHLTTYNGGQAHYVGDVAGIARDLSQAIERDGNAAARSKVSLDYARRPNEEFVDLANSRISRNTALAQRLTDVQTAMGIEPEGKLLDLRPKEIAATPA